MTTTEHAAAIRATLHSVMHWPSSSVGWGVCACGATIRVERGAQIGNWHACAHCVHDHEG